MDRFEVQNDVGGKAAVTWQEKLEYLREQEAIAVDPSVKFKLKKDIEEAEGRLREIRRTKAPLGNLQAQDENEGRVRAGGPILAQKSNSQVVSVGDSGASERKPASPEQVSKHRDRANSDDAQTIEETFFYANSRALVISNIQPNKLRVGGRKFRVRRNPYGEGCFVYDPRTRFHGVKRNLVWWIPEEGRAYPLNGPSKLVTPSLNWPREEGVDAPATSTVIDYVFKVGRSEPTSDRDPKDFSILRVSYRIDAGKSSWAKSGERIDFCPETEFSLVKLDLESSLANGRVWVEAYVHDGNIPGEGGWIYDGGQFTLGRDLDAGTNTLTFKSGSWMLEARYDKFTLITYHQYGEGDRAFRKTDQIFIKLKNTEGEQ